MSTQSTRFPNVDLFLATASAGALPGSLPLSALDFVVVAFYGAVCFAPAALGGALLAGAGWEFAWRHVWVWRCVRACRCVLVR
jgi:hypothetical protein